jgi:hypothetical protein
MPEKAERLFRHVSYMGTLFRILRVSLLVSAIALPCLVRAELSKRLADLGGRDTTVAIWIIFADKQGGRAALPTTKASMRRQLARHSGFEALDVSVPDAYLTAVRSMGARQRQVFKWANAASFAAPARRLDTLDKLPFVKRIIPVRAGQPISPLRPALEKARAGAAPSPYGYLLQTLQTLDVPAAHERISDSLHQDPGSGVIVAVFDNGFTLTHKCFDHIRTNGQVIADSDFIDNDSDVTYIDGHGTQTLSLIAGYDPGSFIGTAWGARFILVRTEDDAVEQHSEEDSWAAAVVWAESLGADIVSSSVGYRYDFNSPDTDYTFAAMDGKTTIISLAASEAARRGVIIVNAMGNEGDRFGDASVNAPADVPEVVSVGALGSGDRIASFSSLGPTADGRIKPDCVAPGQNIAAPVYNSPESYTSNQGTSFSTPLVAGICALIRQYHSGQTPDMVRACLYASCRFSSLQDSIDNTYGRGIPDALVALQTAPATAYIQLRDSLRIPIAQAAIYRQSDSTIIASTDSSGVAAAIVAANDLPETVFVKYYGTALRERIIVPATPVRITLTLSLFRCIIRLHDSAAGALFHVRGGTVRWNKAGTSYSGDLPADTAGQAIFQYSSFGEYRFWADAPGYQSSDTVRISLAEKPDSVVIPLIAFSAASFRIYPNVISRSQGDARLHYAFIADPGDWHNATAAAYPTVRGIDGTIIWKDTQGLLEERGQIFGSWDLRAASGALAAPGMYLFVLHYAGKTYQKKFIIRR